MRKLTPAAIAISGLVALLVAGPAMAGSDADRVAALEARKAELQKVIDDAAKAMAEVNADLGAEGVQIVPASTTTSKPDPAGPGVWLNVAGYGELFVGVQNNWEEIDNNTDGEGLNINGGGGINLVTPVSDYWNLQLEAFAGGSSELSGDDDYVTRWGGGGPHLFKRDGDTAYGLFAGLADVKADEGALIVTAGVEGASFTPDSTIIGQAAYLSRFNIQDGFELSDDDFISNGMLVRGVYRHFFDENMMLSGGVTAAWGQMDSSQDDFFGGQIDVAFEHRPDGWPVSYFARLTSAGATEFGDDAGLINRFILGTRMYFGEGSLRSNDQHGATFDLPPFRDLQEMAGAVLE